MDIKELKEVIYQISYLFITIILIIWFFMFVAIIAPIIFIVIGSIATLCIPIIKIYEKVRGK